MMPSTRGGAISSLAVDQMIEQAAMPGLVRARADVETQPTVGMDGAWSPFTSSYPDRAEEVPVAIGQWSASGAFRTSRCGYGRAGRCDALHIEHIGEVGPERDLQVEPHRLLAMVGDIDVLVQPPSIARPSMRPACVPGRRRPRSGSSVGQEDPRGVIGDRSTAQQFPWFAIGVQAQPLIMRVSRKYSPFSMGQLICPSGSVTSTVRPDEWRSAAGRPGL